MKLPKPLRFLRNIILFFFISTILAVVAYRFVPVYITPLMVIRSVQQVFKGESPCWHHTWVSSDKISPHLPMAVIASEDNRFATHNGFDFIEKILSVSSPTFGLISSAYICIEKIDFVS